MARPHYLCIGAIFKNEARYLAEWAAFHLARGVDHLFVYDNNSTDGPELVLAPFVAAGRLTLTRWTIPFSQGAQARAYAHCLAEHGPLTRWLAFIDIDEFLFSPLGSLPEMLPDFEAHPQIVVNWQCYGSSGHLEPVSGPIADAYLRRAPTGWTRNRRVKSVVDPSRTLRSAGPHFFEYRDGALAVTEQGRPVRVRSVSVPEHRFNRALARLWPAAPVDPYCHRDHDAPVVSVERLRINHYAVRSLAEYREKQVRKAARKYDMSYFRYHDRNDVLDPILAAPAPG